MPFTYTLFACRYSAKRCEDRTFVSFKFYLKLCGNITLNLTEECSFFFIFSSHRVDSEDVLSLILLIRFKSRFMLRPSTKRCPANLSSL